MSIPTEKLNNDFRKNLGKRDGYYCVRLGPKKIYMVEIGLDYTPNFDKKQIGTKTARPFFWSEHVLVKDDEHLEPRKLTDRELELDWIKSNLRAVVNYQRVLDRDAKRRHENVRMNDRSIEQLRYKRGNWKHHWRVEQNA